MSLKKIRQGARYRKAYNRLSQQPNQTVTAWAESSLWATQQYLDEYQRGGDPAAAAAVVDGAINLLAAGDVLLDKAD